MANYSAMLNPGAGGIVRESNGDQAAPNHPLQPTGAGVAAFHRPARDAPAAERVVRRRRRRVRLCCSRSWNSPTSPSSPPSSRCWLGVRRRPGRTSARPTGSGWPGWSRSSTCCSPTPGWTTPRPEGGLAGAGRRRAGSQDRGHQGVPGGDGGRAGRGQAGRRGVHRGPAGLAPNQMVSASKLGLAQDQACRPTGGACRPRGSEPPRPAGG